MDRGVFAIGVRRFLAGSVAVGAVAGMQGSAGAEVLWRVSFADAQELGSLAPRVASSLLAAGADWSQYIGGDALLDIQVIIDSTISRVTGRSVTSDFLFHNGEMEVWDQGAASEIRTGVDPNGGAPDIEIRLSPTYLANELWLDPDPTARTATVPSSRTDAVSVFLHEIGHALGFNGWRDAVTGATPGYGSAFDLLTVFDGTDTYFHGPMAIAEYGGPVPLTRGNAFHLGNVVPYPGSDLRGDLMNGVVFRRGQRYAISRLDLAILSDLGLDVWMPEVPAPGTGVVVMAAVGVMGMRRRR
jgi:hypothetical protein